MASFMRLQLEVLPFRNRQAVVVASPCALLVASCSGLWRWRIGEGCNASATPLSSNASVLPCSAPVKVVFRAVDVLVRGRQETNLLAQGYRLVGGFGAPAVRVGDHVGLAQQCVSCSTSAGRRDESYSCVSRTLHRLSGHAK
jgi:hypothetical protein